MSRLPPCLLALLLFAPPLWASEPAPTKLDLARVARVEVSSSLPPWKGYRFGVENLFDGDLRSSWQTKSGVGEWVRVTFTGEARVSAVGIANGFQRTDALGDLFLANSRIKTAKVSFSDGSTQTLAFDETQRGVTRLAFEPRTISWLKLEVVEVFKGRKWTDVAVSEFELEGTAEAKACPAAVPVFDGREPWRFPKPDPVDVALAKRQVLPAARACKPTCSGDRFAVTGAATGSFTQPGARQKALSYSLCEESPHLHQAGIAVFEGTRLVSHVAFESPSFTLRTAPHLLPDGRDGFVKLMGYASMGEEGSSVEVLTFSEGTLSSLGVVNVHNDPCLAGGLNLKCKAVRLEAEVVSAGPRLFAETYSRGCQKGEPWQTVSRCQPLEGLSSSSIFETLAVEAQLTERASSFSPAGRVWKNTGMGDTPFDLVFRADGVLMIRDAEAAFQEGTWSYDAARGELTMKFLPSRWTPSEFRAAPGKSVAGYELPKQVVASDRAVTYRFPARIDYKGFGLEEVK